MPRVNGYNVAFKVNNKTFCGRTQDDLTVAATVKESITKDDEGETQYSVSGHEVTFRASAIMEVGTTDNTKMDRDALIAQSLKKGTEAIVPVTYHAGSGQAYGGNAIITNYSESSNSSDEATVNLDFRITGAFEAI